ncbi:MAG: PKD domain-containing protein, partial [Candidatus Falkowbacteria bacterium]
PLAPASKFTATTISGEVPLTVKFINASDGEVISYLWDFGDGQTSAEQQNPEHIYVKSGTYYAKLTVANYSGLSSKIIKISVKPPHPLPSEPELGIPPAPTLWLE